MAGCPNEDSPRQNEQRLCKTLEYTFDTRLNAENWNKSFLQIGNTGSYQTSNIALVRLCYPNSANQVDGNAVRVTKWIRSFICPS